MEFLGALFCIPGSYVLGYVIAVFVLFNNLESSNTSMATTFDHVGSGVMALIGAVAWPLFLAGFIVSKIFGRSE